MRSSFALISALLVLALWAPGVSARTYGDTLTVIWRPLPNLPSFARPGDTLVVWANAPDRVSGWEASLLWSGTSVPLALAGAGFVPARARWEIGFEVPAGTPEELYDLVLSSDETPPDTSRRSVKVLPAFRDEFYFAQISDTHLPTHVVSSWSRFDPADTSAAPDFNAVADDLNLIHPEFILHTGDLVNEGELEEHLGVFAMGQAQRFLARLRDPLFLVSGNHDIGGWQATGPPQGTARRNWWRYFGWPFLEAPPPGERMHTHDFSFDYGMLHCTGLEAYVNCCGYDNFQPLYYGLKSFTTDQLNRLATDLASVPPERMKLLFYHYDFGGTTPGTVAPELSQISPVALGVAGAIWGHQHDVPDTGLGASPFNLGVRAVCDGQRTFRIFRVRDGRVIPGPMHSSGGSHGAPVDSLTVTWSGRNDGTCQSLTARIVNLFSEPWERARLVFHLQDGDSTCVVEGGTIARIVRRDGRARVYVDAAVPALGVLSVTARFLRRPVPAPPLEFAAPAPNPFLPSRGVLSVSFSLPAAGPARVRIYDLTGRVVAWLHDGPAAPGPHTLLWRGRDRQGQVLPAGIYVAVIETEWARVAKRFALVP